MPRLAAPAAALALALPSALATPSAAADLPLDITNHGLAGRSRHSRG